MKYAAIVSFVLFFSFTSDAQTVLLSVDNADELKTSKWGQNLNKYAHLYFRFAAVASSDNPGARIVYGGSVDLAFGVRKKYKLSSFYSLGYDLELSYTDYKLKQEEGKIMPDTIINNKSQRLDYYSAGIGFYSRLNFDPSRGNFIGNYLDIGIMGTWDYSIKQISKNKLSDGTTAKNIVKGLPFVNDLNAKALVRLGFSHLSFYGSYRLFDLFKPSYSYPELPKLIVGIEISAF